MNVWKIVLATVVIFGTGVVTGGLLVSHAQRVNARQMRRITNALETWRARPAELLRSDRENPRPLLDQRRLEFVLSVQRQLKLTPEQRARIEQIVREGQEKTREITESIRPQLREHWAEVNRRIRAELTPAQRARFDELIKQRPWAQRGPGPGPGSPPRNAPHFEGQDQPLPPMHEPGASGEPQP
jgi:hypothetical protein